MKTIRTHSVGILLLVVVFLYNISLAGRGVDLEDEGYHLTNQALLFSGENHATLPFETIFTDLVGGFWLSLHHGPSLMWARIGGCLILSINALMVFLTLRKFFDETRVFLVVTAVSVLISAFNIDRIIHYFTFPSLIVNVSIYIFSDILQSGSNTRRFFPSCFLLGLIFPLLVLSRVNFILSPIIPASLVAYLIAAKHSLESAKKSTPYILAGFFIALSISYVFLESTVGTGSYLKGLIGVVLQRDYSADLHLPQAMFTAYIGDVFVISVFTLAFLAILGVLVHDLPRWLINLAIPLLVLMITASAIVDRGLIGLLTNTVTFFFGILTVYAVYYVLNDRTHDKVISQLMVVSLGFLLISPLGSNSGLVKSFHEFWFILPLVLLTMNRQYGVERPFFDLPPAFSLRNISVIDYRVVSLAVLMIAGAYSIFFVYGEDGVGDLSTPFRTQGLEGIYSSPEKVMYVDSAVNKVRNLTTRGDEILLTDYPLLYYLTETKPVFGRTYLSGDRLAYIKSNLDDAANEKRLPKLFLYVKHIDCCGQENKTEYLMERMVKDLNYSLLSQDDWIAIYISPR